MSSVEGGDEMRKAQKRGLTYEKNQAKKRGATHVGGPGKPDYVRGKTKGEVRNWKQPVHSGVVRDAGKKGVKEISSKSGFTEPAKTLAKTKNIKLIHRNKKV